jgi:antitoxin component YwqK of YwqJK toxin-antitoxin module
MARSANWIAVAIGLTFASAGMLPVQAQKFSGADSPRPARADFVVDIPDGEDEVDTGTRVRDYIGRDSVERDSIETGAASAGEEDSAGETNHPRMENRCEVDESIAPDEPGAEVIKERFPDGSVKIEREVTQDSQGNYLNHGSWKMWDARGNLIAQGQYQLGNRTGTWIRWYRNTAEAELLGKAPYQQFATPFISQATFRNDLLDGDWTIYDGKKRLVSKWGFADGKREGTSTWIFANGHKMREIQYHNGDIDGRLMEWNPESKLIVNDTYQAGRKLAQKAAQHAGGSKKSEATYLFAKEVEKSPDDWWSCKLQVTTKEGKDEKHGPWISWYTNGQRQQVGTYEHDVQVGLFTWWHTNGQKALEGRFDAGKQDGTWTWWHQNGQKAIHGEYARGNPTGRWTWWKEDGKVAQSADLSHSEGVVIETPRNLEPNALPHATKPRPRVQYHR